MDNGEKLISGFIDLTASFQGPINWKCLKAIKFPVTLKQVIKSTYQSIKARLQISGERSGNSNGKNL